MAAESVFDAVSAITFGPAQTFRNLTLIPVIADDPVHADYLTLDEALGAKALRIEETSDAGTVPELQVLNDGERGSVPPRRRGTCRRQAESRAESQHPRAAGLVDHHPCVVRRARPVVAPLGPLCLVAARCTTRKAVQRACGR